MISENLRKISNEILHRLGEVQRLFNLGHSIKPNKERILEHLTWIRLTLGALSKEAIDAIIKDLSQKATSPRYRSKFKDGWNLLLNLRRYYVFYDESLVVYSQLLMLFNLKGVESDNYGPIDELTEDDEQIMQDLEDLFYLDQAIKEKEPLEKELKFEKETGSKVIGFKGDFPITTTDYDNISRITAELQKINKEVSEMLKQEGFYSVEGFKYYWKDKLESFLLLFEKRAVQEALRFLDENERNVISEMLKYDKRIRILSQQQFIDMKNNIRKVRSKIAQHDEFVRKQPYPGTQAPVITIPISPAYLNLKYIQRLESLIEQLTYRISEQKSLKIVLDIIKAYIELMEHHKIFVEKKVNRVKLKEIENAANQDELVEIVRKLLIEYLRNIQETRVHITTKKLTVWELPIVIRLTMINMHIGSGSALEQIVQSRIQEAKEKKKMFGILVASLAIGLGVLAALPTGGNSIVAALAIMGFAGSFLVSFVTAANTLEEYLVSSAAAGTDFDKAKAISETDPNMFWLGVDLVALGLDAFQLIKAFKVMKSLSKSAGGLNNLADAGKIKTSLSQVGIEIGDDAASKIASNSTEILRGAKEIPERTLNSLRRIFGKEFSENHYALLVFRKLDDSVINTLLSAGLGNDVLRTMTLVAAGSDEALEMFSKIVKAYSSDMGALLYLMTQFSKLTPSNTESLFRTAEKLGVELEDITKIVKAISEVTTAPSIVYKLFRWEFAKVIARNVERGDITENVFRLWHLHSSHRKQILRHTYYGGKDGAAPVMDLYNWQRRRQGILKSVQKRRRQGKLEERQFAETIEPERRELSDMIIRESELEFTKEETLISGEIDELTKRFEKELGIDNWRQKEPFYKEPFYEKHGVRPAIETKEEIVDFLNFKRTKGEGITTPEIIRWLKDKKLMHPDIEIHHILPQRLRKLLEYIGWNIDDPLFTRGVWATPFNDLHRSDLHKIQDESLRNILQNLLSKTKKPSDFAPALKTALLQLVKDVDNHLRIARGRRWEAELFWGRKVGE